MLGLMQDWSMTLDKIIEHARVNFPRREIATRSVEGPIVHTTYEEVWRRAKQVSAALKDVGVVEGDRVATLAWNTARHLEAWYGAMCIGAVLHTVNPRLFPEQIAWIINHAADKVLMLDLTFVPLVEKIAPELKSVETYVILTDARHMPKTSLPGAVAYEDFIAGRPLDTPWGGFDEHTAAGLCYTSGTTGDPKGVLYSHRSNMIHAMIMSQTDVFGCGAADAILPIVPLFHANAWAISFVAPMVGAKLVMPGAKLDGASVHELIEKEQVTFAAAVPTVWLMLLNHLRETGGRVDSLKRVVIGGAAVPENLLRGFEDEYGVEVLHGWGMTEMSPIGTVGKLLPWQAAADRETQVRTKLKQGRSVFTVEMKIVDDAGKELPHDAKTFGRLLVRGPSIAKSYFRGAGNRNGREDALEPCGYFDTGDVANICPYGYMQITDRAKDVIKSGGEWISSIDIENIAVGYEGVACAAVIGVRHPKWDERPLLVIEPKRGAQLTRVELLQHLEGKIAKWWTPDDVVFVEKIPLGATGKINKLALREAFKDYTLPSAQAAQ
ncbi:MAG TPA: long-chain-fatty-acid--CoA ligase [Caulobacterales bacterium]|nr:long-chain-fatty-acid--CoA ligase [Caulobacterales bacterium]